MAKKAAVDPESATTQVNIADFQRTRDSHHAQALAQFTRDTAVIVQAVQQLDQIRVHICNQLLIILDHPAQIAKTSDQVIVALATLQSSVQDLSRAYINHANTVLAPGRGGELNSNLTNILSESGLLNSQPSVMPVLEDAVAGVEGGKKKRKRVPHDPNAPKRALTPYFLYMQSARTQIAKELGENAKPKEVADEGTRRWGEMPPAEKAVWDQQYQKNLAVYRVRMAAYKAGQEVPDEDLAARLVEAGKIADIPVLPEEEVEVEVEEESSPEPVREPSPPKSKRRKSEKAASPVKETPKARGSEKKSKKAKKEASPAPEPASTSKGTDKKKRSKKA